jgi:peptidyl-prolyl cis-trans isomerase D
MIMQTMRKIGVFVLWILILAFIGWIGLELGANIVGYKVYQPWERGIIAKIGNYELTFNEFNLELEKAINDTTRKLGRELTGEEFDNLRKKVFDDLVDRIRWKLLLEDLKISLTKDAIVKAIVLFPPPEVVDDTIFYTDGKFDYGKYISLLRDQRSIPFFKIYEERLKTEIPRDIIRYYLSVMSNVSDEEAKYEFLYRNRRVKILYANIPISLVPDTIKLSEEEKRNYYNQNKEEFKAPARVKLIVIRATKIPSYNDTILARDKAEMIKEQVKSGENFNKLAFLFSADLLTKNDSGRVKNFLINNLFPEVRDSFLKANENQIIGPILTPLGYYLYKIDRKNKDTVDFSQILIKITPSIETKKLIIDSIKNAIKTKNLEGFRVDTTTYIPINSPFYPIVGENQDFKKFLEKGKVGDFSEVFDIGNILTAFIIIDKKKEGYQSYDEVKNIVEARALVKKKKEILKSSIDKVSQYLKNNDTSSIRSLFNNDQRVVILETGLITSDMFIQGLPFNDKDKFFNRVFEKGLNEVDVFEHDLGFIVYKKLEDVLPDLSQFENQKIIIKSQLYQRNLQNLINAFERELKEKYPLEDYSEHFK